jgi:hypothetical protein
MQSALARMFTNLEPAIVNLEALQVQAKHAAR